jgi:hypothetical protein
MFTHYIPLDGHNVTLKYTVFHKVNVSILVYSVLNLFLLKFEQGARRKCIYYNKQFAKKVYSKQTLN